MYRVNHENLKVELTAGGKSLAEVKIQRDTPSAYLFKNAMMLLNNILRKCTNGYRLNKSQENIMYVMYIDDIELLAKNEKELDFLIQAVRIYNHDIGMELDIEKCTILIIWSSKLDMKKGIELLNEEKLWMLGEKET